MEAAFRHFFNYLLEDKSAARKSMLNMSDSDAKKAKAKEEEEAKKKARRLGTVSSLMDRFKSKEPEIKPEVYTYKRSPMLEKKDERPKRKFAPLVKPVVNDDFDKQMAEIREQIKSGSTQLTNQVQNLRKGINSVAGEARQGALEEKHKSVLHATGDVFTKVDENTKKWKEQRAAEHEAELKKQEEALHRPKPARVVPQKAPEPTPLAERKQTVRRLKPASDDAKPAPSFATEPKKAPERKVEPAKLSTTKPSASVQPKPASPAAARKTTQAPPSPTAVRKNSATKKPTGLSEFASRFDSTVGAAPVHKLDPSRPAPFGQTTQTASPAMTATAKPIPSLAKRSGPMEVTRPNLSANKSSPAGADRLNTTAKDRALGTSGVKNKPELAKPSASVAAQKPVVPTMAGKQPTAVTQKADENTAPASVGHEVKSDGAAANRIKRVFGNAENKVQKKYGATRKKTEELMNFAKDDKHEEEEDKPHRMQCVHRRNRFIREPFDIDVLLGFNKENTFEDFEARFTASARDKRPSSSSASKSQNQSKRRRLDSRKVWISELQDIDKIYKTSELRDIISSAQ